MSGCDLVYGFSVDTDLVEATQDNGDVKDILSVSLKKRHVDAESPDEFQYIVDRIANPLIEVGYDVNSHITYDDEVVQEIVVNIDVTTSTTAWNGASSCRFFQDLETILREVTPQDISPCSSLKASRTKSILPTLKILPCAHLKRLAARMIVSHDANADRKSVV